jgi:hypothetical protein
LSLEITNFTGKVEEVADQIFKFELLTPEFCAKLVNSANQQNAWMPESQLDKVSGVVNAPVKGAPSLINIFDRYRQKYYGTKLEQGEHQETLPLSSMQGMEEIYVEMVRRYVAPLIQKIWPTWEDGIWDQPYILKYCMGEQKSMAVHHDEELVALIVYINDEFTGGGTIFPRQKYQTGKLPVGTAILYSAGISHPHGGIPITSGCRYLLLGAFQ